MEGSFVELVSGTRHDFVTGEAQQRCERRRDVLFEQERHVGERTGSSHS